jgi:hypothetical protein
MPARKIVHLDKPSPRNHSLFSNGDSLQSPDRPVAKVSNNRTWIPKMERR